MAAVEYAYRYAQPSEVRLTGSQTDLLLATSGGITEDGPAEHPNFFDGFLEDPEQAATSLLTCARVARTRYYMPPGMVAAILRAADPVVTSNHDRLRFESFSVCCGVYARFDLLSGGLSRRPIASGTTNVDFNPPMREALAGINGRQPMRLNVGAGDVTLRTFAGTVVERKVPLPERWLKGFAEVQLAASGMHLVAELSGIEARRFLRGLPMSSRAPLWAVPSGKTMRLTTQPGTEAVCIAGPNRLRALEPLVRFAKGMRVYGPELPADRHAVSSGWEVLCDEARFVIVLSPEVSRGFSGEGAVLFDLSDNDGTDDVEHVALSLAWEPHVEIDALSRRAGMSTERVRRALTHLSAAGRVGFDLAEGAYFHRELPFDRTLLESMHPRLRDARALVDAGAVRLRPGGADIKSGDVEHRVTFSEADDRCTCPWWGKHHGSRGPCKHVLAARVARRG